MSLPPGPPPYPPAGWYPDPWRQAAQRWWDGTQWTHHTVWPAPPSPPVGVGAVPERGVQTSDGVVELAGWWRRFLGYVIDIILLDLAQFALTQTAVAIDERVRGPLPPGLYPMTAVAQAIVVAVTLVIVLGYPLILLRRFGQTVGMMAVGVRAVDLASGGALTTAQTWRRVLTFALLTTFWYMIAVVIGYNNVVGPTPVSETIFRLVALIGLLVTGLWPLGSGLWQTLQDKAAGTIVIRSRRPSDQLA